MISPESRFKQVFDIVIIVVSLITTIWAAYFACFGYFSNDTLFLAESLIEICFVLDIVLNFVLEYKDPVDFRPVRDL